jgi:hypothetical protein
VQINSSFVPVSRLSSAAARLKSHNREDLVYQAVTVAAILLLLGSVWIF